MSNDEYYNEQEGSVIEPSGSEKKGSILLGTAVGVGITIVFELIVGLALQAESNLVHRYIAYMLGLVPIFVAAIMSRSTLKMVFFGAPVIILSSFGLPHLFPNVFTGLMTPFLTLVPVISAMLESLNNVGAVPDDTLAQFNAFKQYAIVVDFAFGFIVGMFAAIGLTGIVKLVTEKPGILTIFTGLLAIIFLVIGVIFLPYTLVVSSGIAQFGLDMTTGGVLFTEGMQKTNGNGSLEEANELFLDAEKWFNDGEKMLQGLENLGLFGIISSYNAQYRIIVENGLVLMKVAVNLAESAGPAFVGISKMQQGMEQAMATLEDETASTLALSQSDQFNDGLDLMEEGFKDITRASDEIKQAISELDNLQQEELRQAINTELGTSGDVVGQLDLILNGAELFNYTLDVFTNDAKTGLINDPDGDGPLRAPMINLLQGAYAMNQAQSIIGDNSDFRGTGGYFKDVVGNLTLVLKALDSEQNVGIDRLESADFGDSTEVTNFKDQMVGTIKFLKDVSNVTISIGNFGIVTSPTLTSMNQTLTILNPETSPYENFTVIPDEVYDDSIQTFEFEGNSTHTPGIITNSTIMQNKANLTNQKIATIKEASANDEYGFLGDSANQFVEQFENFNLTQNANNFYYLANSFDSLLKSAKVLSNVDKRVRDIRENVATIRSVADYAQTEGEYNSTSNTTISNSLTYIKGNITTANSTLDTAYTNTIFASNNFSQVVEMPQVEQNAYVFGNISIHITNLQVGNATNPTSPSSNEVGGLTHINAIANQDVSDFISDIQGNLDDLTTELDYISTEFQAIQAELGSASIAG